MKNNKGQALIEFVIILPIFLLILLYVVDITKISLQKYKLEEDMNLVIKLYENNKTQELNNYLDKNNIELTTNTNNNLTTISITKKTKYNMPLLNKILGSKLETKRTIYNEQ